MNALSEQVIHWIAIGMLRHSREQGVGFAKAKAAKIYVHAVDKSRNLFRFMILLSACLTAGAVGWFLSLFGFGLLLELDGPELGLFLLCSGLATMGIMVISFCIMNQESRWLEVSGVNDILRHLRRN